MAVSKEDLVETLSGMTILEVTELVSLLEEKWGVSAAAAVQTVAVAADAGVKEEVKDVRAITGLGLKEAKDMVEGVPSVVKEAANKAEAEGIKKQLEEAGAAVELK